jgi:hypothetical protein
LRLNISDDDDDDDDNDDTAALLYDLWIFLVAA